MKSKLKPDSARHLREAGERALSEEKSADDLLRQANIEGIHEGGIPVTWNDGASGQTHVTSVLQPTKRDLKLYGEPGRPEAVCGHCKFFDLETGRKEIVRQRFFERLELEEQWKLRHLGAPPEAIGLCGASDGSAATTAVSKACDQFRPKR